MAQSAGSPGPCADADHPRHWLGPSLLIDLEDSKLRLRVHALTQLSSTEREKALALYGFVKRLPLARPFKLRPATARQVLAAGRGDAPDKATLLVTMLRVAGIPARIRYVRVRGRILRGLTSRVRDFARPVVEAWLHGRWLGTDTYIFDATYMAAARQRLKDEAQEWGYGIHVRGAMMWDGYESAFVGAHATQADPMVVGELGLFHDPREFMDSRAFRERHARVARLLQMNMLAPTMQRVIHGLRRGPVVRPGPSAGRKPS